VLAYFESSPPFFRPGDAQASKSSDPRARVLTLQVNRPSSPIYVPSPCCLVVFPGTGQENLVHTAYHSRYCRSVGGRAQHTRRILVQLCKHAENPVSSSLPACRDTTCTEPRIGARITCTCTNFGPQNMGRKSNVCAHNNWGVPIKVSELRAVVCCSKITTLPPNRVAWPSRECVACNELRAASNGLYGKSVMYVPLCRLRIPVSLVSHVALISCFAIKALLLLVYQLATYQLTLFGIRMLH
jgi:hypothetical protein